MISKVSWLDLLMLVALLGLVGVVVAAPLMR
jgi:hypothetical protein